MLDNNRLDGKVALVTGAGGEIGEATIRLMAARGARIVAVDRDTRSLQRLSAALPELDLITCEADVADEDARAWCGRSRKAWRPVRPTICAPGSAR
jgi:NADP-dependent 3-hydroxy acid dehydrogenase YdfG